MTESIHFKGRVESLHYRTLTFSKCWFISSNISLWVYTQSLQRHSLWFLSFSQCGGRLVGWTFSLQPLNILVSQQGCASWKWYFPFHYAPFASDFKDIKEMCTGFEKGTKPVRTTDNSILFTSRLNSSSSIVSLFVFHFSLVLSSNLWSNWWVCSQRPVETFSQKHGGPWCLTLCV